jgi:hypothetical protein
MRGKPDGLSPRLGPLHPVTGVCGDEQIIARPQNADLFLVLKEKSGAPGQEDDPLIGVLVIPLPGRG